MMTYIIFPVLKELEVNDFQMERSGSCNYLFCDGKLIKDPYVFSGTFSKPIPPVGPDLGFGLKTLEGEFLKGCSFENSLLNLWCTAEYSSIVRCDHVKYKDCLIRLHGHRFTVSRSLLRLSVSLGLWGSTKGFFVDVGTGSSPVTRRDLRRYSVGRRERTGLDKSHLWDTEPSRQYVDKCTSGDLRVLCPTVFPCGLLGVHTRSE